MTIIPPTHGRATARVQIDRREADPLFVTEVLAAALRRLHDNFREAFGADAPEDWITTEVLDEPGSHSIDIRVEAVAPRRSRVVLIPSEKQTRELPFPVSAESRIPIVQSPYRFDDPFPRPERHLTFKGWDAETGLMVFDR